MASNREALRLELKQIIQADRMAADIIQRAVDTKHQIEKKCTAEKAEILADAKQRREDMEKQVAAEQEENLRNRKAEATKGFEAQKQQLGQQVNQNQESWVAEITARILAGQPPESQG